MAYQHLTGTQHTTSTPHLDGYLKGIKDEFDRLNRELDETRKQRDEYITKCTSQIFCERLGVVNPTSYRQESGQ